MQLLELNHEKNSNYSDFCRCLRVCEAVQSMCTSNVTEELEACAKENFEYSDRILNLTYNGLATKLSPDDRRILNEAEKAWLAYKNATCQGAYHATSPGEEAGIDKWTCLDQITRARTEEMQYLNTGIGVLGFYKALDIVSRLYEGGSREMFISKLTDIFSKSDDKSWRAYVENNRKLAVAKLHEDKSVCIARQVFYLY
ncbi:Lysozyme inhibitor LprI N-terminal domain-containing protein [Paraburkholderia sacchari]|uniref:lysozyme inhibitor LprI family protein n=1 Tax=Paraburkholderia sacchari TaxID=159450 RepID=UPI0039A520C2